MKKTIRTMQGKKLNFDELALRNEKVTAVGNMGVNAAGEPIKKMTEEVKRARKRGKSYRRQIKKQVFDMPVFNSKEDAELEALRMAVEFTEHTKDITEIKDIDKIVTEEDTVVTDDIIIPKQAERVVAPKMESIPKPKKEQHKDNEVSDEILEAVINRKTDGLSSAIAKAKEVEQKRIKTPREEMRSTDGVKRI